MVRRYLLALAVLGITLAVAAGTSRAEWGDPSGSAEQGESMSSESAIPAPEQAEGSYSDPGERSKETSEYRVEEPVETGRMPETGKSEAGEHVEYERGGQLYRQGIDDGP